MSFSPILLLLIATSAHAAISCAPGLNPLSQDVANRLTSQGNDYFQDFPKQFCDTMPDYVTQPYTYNAQVVPQCGNPSLSQVQYQLTWSPKMPCSCDPNICKCNLLGNTGDCPMDQCVCTVPPGFSVSKTMVVTYEDFPCVNSDQYSVAENDDVLGNLDYTLGSNSAGNVGGKCPKNTVAATQFWSRGNIIDLMREALVKKVFNDLTESGSSDDVDMYVCDQGVNWTDAQVSGTSCVKPYKKSAVVNGANYGPQEEVAIIYGSISYRCVGQGRSRSVAFSGTIPYDSSCVPTSTEFFGNLQ